VAAGDVTGNGLADIAVAAGPGGGPHVVVFRGTDLAVLASFFTYNPLVNTGIYVSLADVDGDGRADITTGAGEGFSPHVRVVRVEDQAELASFFAFDPNLVSGARVGPAMQIGGGQRGITVTTGPGSPPVAATFRLPDLVDIGRTLVFNPSFLGGVFVG
jgi:serralysin